MASIPALSKTWSSRMNVPFGSNNTTATLIHQFAVWSLKQHLIDAHTADGTLSGTRNANSVWTVVGSSDGSTAGMDGVDRWTTTFTPSKLVRASAGSAHSWIVLRNTASGWQICLDMNNTANTSMGIIFARNSAGFTGGSTTSRPTASANEEISVGSRQAPSNSSNDAFITPAAVANAVYYSHFSCAGDATFHFSITRASAGSVTFLGFARSVGAHVDDTRNWYAIGGNSSATSSVARYASLNVGGGTFAVSRMSNGHLNSSGGGARHILVGNTTNPSGIDTLSNTYLIDPLLVREQNSSTSLFNERGYIPDFYFIGGATIGSTYPSVNQTHFVFGDMLLPCATGAAPIV